jgi:hypothetical protein
MSYYAQRKLTHTARPAYRTLQGWALGVLVEQQAVTECDHHGHRHDRVRIRILGTGRVKKLGETLPRRHARGLYCRIRRDHAVNRRYLPRLLTGGLHIPALPPIFRLLITVEYLFMAPRANWKAFCGCRS